jgi:lycopene cyclase domain-containing protein
LGIAWLASVAILWLGWQPGAYLALELGWFLPPIALQVIVGGDMLWQQRRLVMAALLPAILYLIISDALAIQQGVWTISPQHTLGVLLGGVLPLEEIVFFTLTNVLIVFGMTLVMVIGRRLLHERQAALRC